MGVYALRALFGIVAVAIRQHLENTSRSSGCRSFRVSSKVLFNNHATRYLTLFHSWEQASFKTTTNSQWLCM